MSIVSHDIFFKKNKNSVTRYLIQVMIFIQSLYNNFFFFLVKTQYRDKKRKKESKNKI